MKEREKERAMISSVPGLVYELAGPPGALASQAPKS